VIRNLTPISVTTWVAWAAVLGCPCSITALAPAGPVDAKWQLIWSDEFDGNTLDPAKWEFIINGRGGGNKELQYYVKENTRVADGLLVIEARKEKYQGPDGEREYTSSRIRTRNKGDWKFGRIEVHAKLPRGKGIWPAIWMMPTDNRYGGWPNSGEIDIMELVGHEPSTVHGTLHYGDREKRHLHKGTRLKLERGTFADDFHTFALEWEEREIRWYVDDKLYQTQKDWHTRDAAFPAPFDQRFHLILNVAVGGNWPGSPDATTEFPAAMVIDYVRVYQRR
jgi:beta-glucanase (GH16 family)